MTTYRKSREATRRELAEFLRARRAELQPEEVGLPRRDRRRVAGLRRHEVADLAGVSDTWYTWLEQGRDINIGVQLLDSVARALKLDEDGWRYVRRLAGAPVIEPQPSPDNARPELAGLVQDLLPSPGCLTTSSFDFMEWNDAYSRVFGDPGELPQERRNALWLLFKGPRRVSDWNRETQDAVARFRSEAAKYPGDERIAAVVADLRAESEEFREAWDLRQVRRFQATEQRIDHPDVGELRLSILQLRPLDQPALVLMIHRPVDEESRGRLEKLVWGRKGRLRIT